MSSNNSFQRKSFIVQKGRHLVKPFVICTTDGHIVDIYGLFEAAKTNASIILDIWKQEEDLRSLLKPNDIFLLDRGFRDAIEKLNKEYELVTKMPCLIKKESKQLNSYEANSTRFVTKCRWVVEAVNSFLKNHLKL